MERSQQELIRLGFSLVPGLSTKLTLSVEKSGDHSLSFTAGASDFVALATELGSNTALRQSVC